MKLDYTTQQPDAITGARALTPESCTAVLNRIASRCSKQILVFDLDSTLLDNRERSAKIMREFGELNNESRLMQAKAKHWQDWSARNAMTAIGLPQTDIDRLIDDYLTFWKTTFFTSEYCQFDTQIAGAAAFVTELKQAGGIIRYLTGRHEGMRAGTMRSLKKLGFPVPDLNKSDLIMKPSQTTSDDDFKKNAMQQLDKESAVFAAFDNEPFHINAYRSAYPKAVCVHLHTDHSMRPIRLLGGIVSIDNFVRQKQ